MFLFEFFYSYFIDFFLTFLLFTFLGCSRMVLFKHLARVTAHLAGAVSCVSCVLNAQNEAHCVGGENQLSPVSLPTSFSLPSLPASLSSNVRFSYGQSGTGMFGSSAVSIPLSQVALPSMSAFAFQASLPAFIAPAGTATGLHAPASAASLPAFIAPAFTATGLHAPASAIHSAANSNAAVAFAEFQTPLVQSRVVVTMANIAPTTVNLPHDQFLELVAKGAAYDEAQRKAEEAQLQATQDAISASNPPPKFLPDFTDECHFAATYPALEGDLDIFCPTNYRSRQRKPTQTGDS